MLIGLKTIKGAHMIAIALTGDDMLTGAKAS